MKKLFALAAVGSIAAYKLASQKMPRYPASDHYSPKTQTFNNLEPQKQPQDVLPALWKMVRHGQDMPPPKPLPEIQPDWATLRNQDGGSRFMWFGHSSLFMQINGVLIATDPVFGYGNSQPPRQRAQSAG